MKRFIPVLLAAMSASAWAADSGNPLSVHVLNQQTGLPSQGVVVDLEQQQGSGWARLAEGKTNADGRIGALWPQGKPMTKGIYKVTFHTGEYFNAQQQASFFPEVPVIFEVTDVNQHLHIPLLLSQYGYATYRGS
ncbi:hydroxyisourate hydrolase [Pantoea sp. 1.19]|uniref:hydroxyisourate hydrolase n=1 Tax=Pantoea sp. 1.19 TaxID=1925589 RepID=UPI000948D246|nr:hydroxyisourate hydrolase [Pantoea sp. 1.19]